MLLNTIVIISSISEHMFLKHPNILGKWSIWWGDGIGKEEGKPSEGSWLAPAVEIFSVTEPQVLAKSQFLPKTTLSCIHIASASKQDELEPIPPGRLGIYNCKPADSNCTSFSGLGKATKQNVIEFSAVC